MKQLEALGLVQFFLYEREDLQLGRNTAFLGPNGTGPGSPLTGEQVADFVVALSTDRASAVHGRSIDLRDPRQVEDALAGRFTTRTDTNREDAR